MPMELVLAALDASGAGIVASGSPKGKARSHPRGSASGFHSQIHWICLWVRLKDFTDCRVSDMGGGGSFGFGWCST